VTGSAGRGGRWRFEGLDDPGGLADPGRAEAQLDVALGIQAPPVRCGPARAWHLVHGRPATAPALTLPQLDTALGRRPLCDTAHSVHHLVAAILELDRLPLGTLVVLAASRLDLRDPVEALGGTIVVESPLGEGTAVFVSRPLDRP
jgi:hypothetical protein